MAFEEERRLCKHCMQQDVEDKKHFLLQLGDVIKES